MRQQIFAAVAAAAMAAAAAPAFAQATTVEELTVIGRYAPLRGEPPVQMSRVVDYSDLDLRLAADQDELRHRVVRAASDVCNRLGRASPNHTNLGTSCRDQAVRDAMNQVGYAVAEAYARPAPAYAYVAPAPAEPYVAPAPATSDEATEAPAATGYGQAASATVTTQTVTNGPVPDTAANRAKFGGPMSNAGRQTKPIGN